MIVRRCVWGASREAIEATPDEDRGGSPALSHKRHSFLGLSTCQVVSVPHFYLGNITLNLDWTDTDRLLLLVQHKRALK